MLDLPASYGQWKHCIEVKCGIALTGSYINSRIMQLQNKKDNHTASFIQLYGEPYHQMVIGWFKQALAEVNHGNIPQHEDIKK